MASITSRPMIDTDTFRELGLMVESNRVIFHPLGVALGTPGSTSKQVEKVRAALDDNAEALDALSQLEHILDHALVVFDGRDDPDGVEFDLADDTYRAMLEDRLDRYDRFVADRRDGREGAMGFFVQPIGGRFSYIETRQQPPPGAWTGTPDEGRALAAVRKACANGSAPIDTCGEDLARRLERKGLVEISDDGQWVRLR